MTRGLPEHLRTEKRILELLEARDREFGELCFELRESPSSVRRAVSELMHGGWIHLESGKRSTVFHAVPGALVGWTRERTRAVEVDG